MKKLKFSNKLTFSCLYYFLKSNLYLKTAPGFPPAELGRDETCLFGEGVPRTVPGIKFIDSSCFSRYMALLVSTERKISSCVKEDGLKCFPNSHPYSSKRQHMEFLSSGNL